ncbi:hypothetical protein CIB48_g1796 [Xylaria polymorpha]|nr:hypothetical protein CIB48_g1796 [Xylaria polymorpha]
MNPKVPLSLCLVTATADCQAIQLDNVLLLPGVYHRSTVPYRAYRRADSHATRRAVFFTRRPSTDTNMLTAGPMTLGRDRGTLKLRHLVRNQNRNQNWNQRRRRIAGLVRQSLVHDLAHVPVHDPAHGPVHDPVPEPVELVPAGPVLADPALVEVG